MGWAKNGMGRVIGIMSSASAPGISTAEEEERESGCHAVSISRPSREKTEGECGL